MHDRNVLECMKNNTLVYFNFSVVAWRLNMSITLSSVLMVVVYQVAICTAETNLSHILPMKKNLEKFDK